MLVRLRREYGQLITSGGQLVLLALGAQIDTPAGWAATALLIALVSLFAWISAMRRARAISDMPTSRVASAAQGYVELLGKGLPLAGTPVVSPLTSRPCLWYRFRIERRENDKWVHDDSGESDASFILDDGSGQCLVDPEGAEILPPRHERWTANDRRYNEWLMLERDSVYVLGYFVTKGSADLRLDLAEDVRALLAEWKTDERQLLSRFDLDGNSELDMREWELARRQARREVAASHRIIRAQAELHVMRRPDDGRLYLISGQPPERLARRYRWWSFAHLAMFFSALAGLSAALRMSG
ncbi:MAG: hypothetical protein OHM77_01515 [Candidatus Nitricoxidivorans perseverans]|uniref:RING-type E3 ubiquitin transferase n=1 Tax=Candidatus Nitricoxidivorans perseverans TaxID=2975601 RepID=A0AA49IW71_9PROT|nr:MAG: hypothetical protein OHM77_01515 [Candidatus Nitricoxidivorans perseverans]